MSQHDVGQVQRLKRATRLGVGLGPFDERRRAADQVDDVRPDRRRRHVVELGGGLVAEPADMLLPDRPHYPRHFPVHLGSANSAGSVTSRIKVHTSAPEFMPSMVRSRR